MSERGDVEIAHFIERFALDLTASGMPRMASRVFAGLLTTDSGSLTAGDIAELLQVSAASVSQAVRHLEHLGLVTRAREPGARRDHYRVDDDVWYQFFTRRDELLLRWTDTARDGVALLGPRSPAGLRLRETLAFLEFVHDELVDLDKRWHERRAELRDRWAAE